MSQAAKGVEVISKRYTVQHKRSRLLDAIQWLEKSDESSALRRIALAEAEFRLAILSGTDLQESIERLREAIVHDPFHPKLFFHLGRCLYQNGEFRDALQAYRRAVQLAPASHRACVHLALTLLELDEVEKNIGRALLDALARGAEHELAKQIAELDDLIRDRFTPSKEKKSQGLAKRKPTESKGGDSKQPAVPCRWNGIWRLSLVEQLSHPNPIRKQIDKHLDTGAKSVNDQTGVAEYATACLFLLLGGDSPKDIAAMLEGEKLKPHAEHPAVGSVRAAVALRVVTSPKQFVECAEENLRKETLPLELVCLLHYSMYGPTSSLSAVQALELLDTYPQPVQNTDCFRELRLAVLDGYARKAWSEEDFALAKVLWRETIALDPNRVAVAHNLALLAARMKSRDDYIPAWNRAVELRYLIAAAASDIRVTLEDRMIMHLSFAQQSQQRYCGPSKPGGEPPKDGELEAWIADRGALDVWLREWDLYYLNSRLRFHSPVHLLGVPRDASPQMIADARDALLDHIRVSLGSQSWVGIKAFCELANALVTQASERASNTIERARDPYYEHEKNDADALAKGAIDRGFLLHRMISALVKNPSAKDVHVGAAIARRLLALPWKILQPICADRGLIERDLDLVKVFESHLLALAAGDNSEPKTAQESLQRLAAVDECIAVLPHRVELRVIRCRLLLAAGKDFDAYSSALDALASISSIEDKEEARTIEHNLTVLVDNAALSELPERVRQPTNVEEAEETLREGRKVLSMFPRAGSLRAFMAHLMIQFGDVAHIDEAIQLLEVGRELALNEERRQEFEDLIQKAYAQRGAARVITEIKNLLEGASRSVNEAIAKINKPGATATAVENAREVAAAAIRDAEQASRLAAAENLHEAETQADELAKQLRELERKLRGH